MALVFTSKDIRKIYKGIKKKYCRVAKDPEGLFRYPTGRAGLEALRYDPEILRSLPDRVLSSYCGVGNPFALGPVHTGESVLDIGCGGGVDALVAALKVGPGGNVTGIERIAKMLKRAKANLRETAMENVSFEAGAAEDLPFPDSTFHVVLSNGVLNLVPDKAKALCEAFRVLRPQGRVMMADQVLTGAPEGDKKAQIQNWCQ